MRTTLSSVQIVYSPKVWTLGGEKLNLKGTSPIGPLHITVRTDPAYMWEVGRRTCLVHHAVFVVFAATSMFVKVTEPKSHVAFC